MQTTHLLHGEYNYPDKAELKRVSIKSIHSYIDFLGQFPDVYHPQKNKKKKRK